MAQIQVSLNKLEKDTNSLEDKTGKITSKVNEIEENVDFNKEDIAEPKRDITSADRKVAKNNCTFRRIADEKTLNLLEWKGVSTIIIATGTTLHDLKTKEKWFIISWNKK